MTSNRSSHSRGRVRRARPFIALLAMVAALAIAGCQQPGQPTGEKGAGKGQGKSPFATDNVSVARQVEGRGPAPTPVPVPRPGQPTSESP